MLLDLHYVHLVTEWIISCYSYFLAFQWAHWYCSSPIEGFITILNTSDLRLQWLFFYPWISSIPNPLFLGLSLVIELQDSKELFKCRHLYLKQMAKTVPSKLAKTPSKCCLNLLFSMCRPIALQESRWKMVQCLDGFSFQI